MKSRISHSTARNVIPSLRFAGYLVLSCLVALHNAFITTHISAKVSVAFALVTIAYSLAAWSAIRFIRSRDTLHTVTLRLAEFDLAFWAAAVYCTGMDQSWLIGILVLRSCDQMSHGSARVLWIVHLSTFAYIAGLLCYAQIAGHQINFIAETVKIACLYCFNMYIYAGTRAVDRLTQRIRETQHALQRAKETAESANRAKSRLMANVTHELRTPLNAILGYTQLVRESLHDLSPAEVDADLAKIELAGTHLLEMVNRVLDLSKIEAGKMAIHLAHFDAAVVARDVVTTIAPLARKRGNQLEVIVQPDLDLVHSDSFRFQQSLLNLLGNACKFTEQGTIQLTLRAEGEASQRMLVAQVADTGIGISPKYQEMLFQAFSQGDPAIAQKYGGTGLGLALTQQLCHLLGGDLSLQSEPNKGTTITMRIPAGQPPSVNQ